MSTSTKLHYIYDPLCGWCYAASPLVQAARAIFPVAAHAGGMMTGDRRRQVSDQWRSFVIPHDRRIAQLSGQPFGAAYFDGLLRDTTAVIDSAPPTAAILAADRMDRRGLDMLARLQKAHYVEGRRIADRPVLIGLAADIGLARDAFGEMLVQTTGAVTEAHIAESRLLLQQAGGSGFPTFALERGGRLQLLDASGFLGDPAGFAAYLSTNS